MSGKTQLGAAATDAVHAEGVVALLETQLRLYRELKASADRQRALITNDDPQALLSLLAERQRVISELTMVGERLPKAESDWPAVTLKMSATQRERSAKAIHEANTLLSAILVSDEQDARLLSARKDATVKQASSLASGRRATAAYQVGSASQGGLIDRMDGTS